jgi:hypothetical protein
MNGQDRPRNPNTGRYVPNPATTDRAAEACTMRANGYTYQQIADTLGYADRGEAHHAVDRALQTTLQEPTDAVRRMELERLDVLYAEAMTVLRRQHLTVSHGRIVKDDTGAPIEDDAPALQAIDRALRVMDRRAKLLGLDAPSRVSVEAEQLGAEILALLDHATPASDDQPTEH